MHSLSGLLVADVEEMEENIKAALMSPSTTATKKHKKSSEVEAFQEEVV